jgi:hypothetical protein
MAGRKPLMFSEGSGSDVVYFNKYCKINLEYNKGKTTKKL